MKNIKLMIGSFLVLAGLTGAAFASENQEKMDCHPHKSAQADKKSETKEQHCKTQKDVIESASFAKASDYDKEHFE